MVDIEQGAARYTALVLSRFKGDQARVKSAVCAVYGQSHEQDEDESDSQYVVRCLEQDFVDGFNDAAMFQDLFALASGQV